MLLMHLKLSMACSLYFFCVYFIIIEHIRCDMSILLYGGLFSSVNIINCAICLIGERAKRVRHSQVCSIENRIYIIY